MKLTVYFDGQFWVGVVEEEYHQSLRVARHIFGAEPKDTEVLAFVNRNLPGLLDLSAEDLAQPSAGRIATPAVAKINPKRRARQAAAEVQAQGISTRSQQALQREYEDHKRERQDLAREQRDADLERKWLLKRDKAKARHRGS